MINCVLSCVTQGLVRLLVATSIVFSLAVVPALADDFPKRKSGLWEIKISLAESPGAPPTVQTCVDEKTDNMMEQYDDMDECSNPEVRRDGDRLIMDSVCKSDETTMKSHTVMTGRLDSAYRAEIKTTYDPPMSGMKEDTMVIEGHWLGPCKPGQKPGDVVLPQMFNFRPGGDTEQ